MAGKSEKKMSDNSKFRSGFVTIVGRPNVGKSTLMNQIVGMKIAITSSKPQTTRKRIQTVFTNDEGQIIFLDTPGIHKAKNRLGEYMDMAAEKTLNEADCILWLVEPSSFIGAGEREIAEKLKKCRQPVILVINKSDTVKREQLLPCINAYKDIVEFREIIPLSALNGDGCDVLISSIISALPEGPALYDEDTVTDETERQITGELIREKALKNLSDEVPHGIAVEVESMKVRGNITDIEATIFCERESHKGIIIGRGGSMLKKIGTEARKDIEELLEMHVNLKLWVKVKKDWRDSESLMKSFGYDQRDLK